jgi:putative DNA-invertase from lambdoid prophage Rac
MRVAIYTRVSTKDQSCEMQLADLRRYAASLGHTVVEEYVDYETGQIGKRTKGTRYDDLLRDARLKLFDAVLVWKYDRLARSLVHLDAICKELEALGIAFIASTQSIDTTTPIGKFFLHILGSFAEFELALLKERCAAGRKRVQDTGLNRHGVPTRLGRPEEVSADKRDRVVDAYFKGQTLSWISEKEHMALSSIHRILERSVLRCEHGKFRCRVCKSAGRIPVRIAPTKVSGAVG